MIERGMLTSNHTSQNATSPAKKLWANNEGMLASTFNCFFGIPSKRLGFLHPEGLHPSDVAMLLESKGGRSCYPGGSRKNHAPQDDAMGERETSKKNQARS